MKKELFSQCKMCAAAIIAALLFIALGTITVAFAMELMGTIQSIVLFFVTVFLLWMDVGYIDKHFVNGEWV